VCAALAWAYGARAAGMRDRNVAAIIVIGNEILSGKVADYEFRLPDPGNCAASGCPCGGSWSFSDDLDDDLRRRWTPTIGPSTSCSRRAAVGPTHDEA